MWRSPLGTETEFLRLNRQTPHTQTRTAYYNVLVFSLQSYMRYEHSEYRTGVCAQCEYGVQYECSE